MLYCVVIVAPRGVNRAEVVGTFGPFDEDLAEEFKAGLLRGVTASNVSVVVKELHGHENDAEKLGLRLQLAIQEDPWGFRFM